MTDDGDPTDHIRGHREYRLQVDEKEKVLDAVTEAFNDFVFYNRKLDGSLPPSELLRLIREGVVTKKEIVAEFGRLIDGLDVGTR